jgi:hypothetical protein
MPPSSSGASRYYPIAIASVVHLQLLYMIYRTSSLIRCVCLLFVCVCGCCVSFFLMYVYFFFLGACFRFIKRSFTAISQWNESYAEILPHRTVIPTWCDSPIAISYFVVVRYVYVSCVHVFVCRYIHFT